MNDPTEDGGCLCGTIRFQITGPINPAVYCHCTDCRKTTGSAFAISFPIDAKHFTITSGEPKAYATLSDHGNTITRHFCLSCGSPIYTEISSHPERVYVKAGAMDNPDIIHPEMEIWTASRVDWATPSDDLMSFREERTPPSSKT